MKIDKDWKTVQSENENIATMLSYSPKYYQKRLEKIGFEGKKTKLLDAGCGAGHWTAAASDINKEVCGIDSTETYLAVAYEIKEKLKIENCKLKIGKLENLPYSDNYFDFVFSYCVWMYTDRSKSIKEIYRVLKPGGKIYLGAITGLGWYLKMIGQAIINGDRNLLIESLRAIKDRIHTNESEARKLFKENNFRIIGLDKDASLGDKKIKIKPIYQDKILGFWNVYEILAIKDEGVS